MEEKLRRIIENQRRLHWCKSVYENIHRKLILSLIKRLFQISRTEFYYWCKHFSSTHIWYSADTIHSPVTCNIAHYETTARAFLPDEMITFAPSCIPRKKVQITKNRERNDIALKARKGLKDLKRGRVWDFPNAARTSFVSTPQRLFKERQIVIQQNVISSKRPRASYLCSRVICVYMRAHS